jgi:hypothetical protein
MPIATFLSHSAKNKEMAGAIGYALEFCGFDVFIAHDRLEVGEQWEREILHMRCRDRT